MHLNGPPLGILRTLSRGRLAASQRSPSSAILNKAAQYCLCLFWITTRARARGMSRVGAGNNTTTTPSTASATAPGPRGTGRGAIRVGAAPRAEQRAVSRRRGRLISCPGRVPKVGG